jgi:hypothetical protein
MRGGGWNVLRFFVKALIWRGIIFQTRLFHPHIEQDAQVLELTTCTLSSRPGI